MTEKEIAEEKVIPYLEKLGWPKQLITQYGKVPVQMGTAVKWADIVTMFVDENDSAIPYLVIEVKTALTKLNEILNQTDSYSKLLDVQYFAATDGESYLFYQRRLTGGYIRITNLPIPEKTYLTVTKTTKFKTCYPMCEKPGIEAIKQLPQYEELSKRLDNYFNLMSEEKYFLGRSGAYSLRRDITSHYKSIKWINKLVNGEIDSISSKDFKDYFEGLVMCGRKVNRNRIFSVVDNDFERVQAFLKFIQDFEGDPEENLNILFDRASELHIDGIGPFITSQFLAGAYPKNYTIIEDKMVDTLKKLGLIDTKVKSDTAKGYLYINEVCRDLYNEVFSEQIEKNRDKLGPRLSRLIDEDFSLIVIHEFFWEYEEFQSYNINQLEEAVGEKRVSEENETDLNLEMLELITKQNSK